MRHGDKLNNLGRTHSHRKAMLANLASSLILHKRISIFFCVIEKKNKIKNFFYYFFNQ